MPYNGMSGVKPHIRTSGVNAIKWCGTFVCHSQWEKPKQTKFPRMGKLSEAKRLVVEVLLK